MIHRHCIQQTFHIPFIQLNMPPEIINTDATFERRNFVLMVRLQAHNFSLLYQEMILDFICQHFQIGCQSTQQKIVAVLLQVQKNH